MPSLISIIIVVSGIVFTTGLLGTLVYDQYEKIFSAKNLTCNCRVDLDADVFPWQISLGRLKIDPSSDLEASLERLQEETHICGGILVNRKYALASSHCVRFSYDQKLGVGMGSGDLIAIHNKGRIPVKQIVYNSSNQIDDVCLIELEREIDFESETLVKPACFRESEKVTEITNDLIATGWNLIEKSFANKDYFSIQRYHNQLKFKDVSFTDNNCNRKSRICARSKESSKCECFPDTGGPLHELISVPNITTVVGIHQVSFVGNSNRSSICPEVFFTRIASKLEFIKSVVKNQICLV